MKRVLRFTLRAIRNLLIGLSLLVLFGLWALKSSWVQEQLLPPVERMLEKQLGVAVEIGGLELDLPARVVVSNAVMYDKQGQRTFAAHEVQVSLLSFSLWNMVMHPSQTKELTINHLQLIQPEARLYKSRRDSSMNLDFLSGSSSDTTASKPLALDLELPEIILRGGIFTYIDSTASNARLQPNGRVNFKNMQFRRINGRFSFHLHPDQNMDANIMGLSAAEDQVPFFLTEFTSQTRLYNDPKDPDWLLICLDDTHVRTGRTDLKFSGNLANQRPDTSFQGFFPVFSANIEPSRFDFTTLNYLLPKSLPMRDVADLEGFVWGDLNGIFSDSLQVGIYDNTHLRMRTEITNYLEEDDLRFDLGIHEGLVSFEELGRFLPGTEVPLSGIARVTGGVRGNLDTMKTRALRVRYGRQTDLDLEALIYNYVDGDAICMEINFSNSHLGFTEVGMLLPSMNLPPWLSRFGRTGIEGSFVGGPDDFVVVAEMTSEYGDAKTDLHLMLPPRVPDLHYEGRISTIGLNLAAMEADIPVKLRNFNFEGKIKGHGDEFETMEADIEGKITDSYIEDYFFQEIETDSLRIANQRITGGVNLTDRHGNANLKLDVQLSDSLTAINVDGSASEVDLAYYEVLAGDSVLFSGNFGVHLEGDSLEDFTGSVTSDMLMLARSRTPDTLLIDKFALSSSLSERHEHTIHLRSSVIDMDMRGSFTYGKALKLVNRISTEVTMYIQNNDTVLEKYYASKILEPEDVNIWDTITVRDTLNDVLSFFKVPLYIQPGSKLYSELKHSMIDELTLRMEVDSLASDSIWLNGNRITLHVVKDGSKNELALDGVARTDTLRVNENLVFKNLLLRPEGGDSVLSVELKAEQPEIGNDYYLVTRTTFLDSGKVVTRIRPWESYILIRGNEWRFSETNNITREFGPPPSIDQREYPDSLIARYLVDTLVLSNSGQKITIGGEISSDFLDILTVTVDSLRIKSLLEILEEPIDIDGTINSTTLTAYSLLGEQPTFGGTVFVDDFRYKTGDALDIIVTAGWPKNGNSDLAGMDLWLGRHAEDSVVVSGTYDVSRKRLSLKSDSSRFVLAWAEPLLEGALTDMEGKIEVDNFTVEGPLDTLEMNGVVHLEGAGFRVDYLNNFFKLGNDSITFDNNGADIKHIVVSDTLGGVGILHGKVRQVDGKFISQLTLDSIQNLTVMDTRKGLNPDFYGKVTLANGNVNVTGKIPNVEVSTDVTTGSGSWLDIPLTDYTSARRLDFVHFIREGDTLRSDSTVDIGGLTLNLKVNATPDARVRLIFDEKVGDIIEAKGAGTISLEIDKEGSMKMGGTYTLTEGNYLFTAENIVNKKFLVKEGGTITWNGEPDDANVDITAIYKVNADISALVPNSTTRVPVEILMHMTGSLLQPKIELSLGLQQLTGGDVSGLASYFRNIEDDQQELNKQVVSLLLFRRFTGHSASGGGGVAGAGVTSSISELISNQVNFWISQAFDNANLGVELNTNEFQDVELALKASLFNNKVTVERNGAIVSNNGGGFSIGDLSVQIKLLPASDSSRVDPKAGQLVMEIFNREDATMNNANNISRGLGLFYKKDFDRISDLFGKKEKMKEEEEETSPIEEEVEPN